MTDADDGVLLDATAFRRFVNSVGVVAVGRDDHVLAMTAEWCTPVSLAPRLLGVYVGAGRFTETGMEAAAAFGLSLLTASQASLAHVLGSTSGWQQDKEPLWAADRIRGPVLGVPLVAGASAHFECEVVDAHVVGDHVLWIGRPVGAGVSGPDAPLLYHSGRYWSLGPIIAKPHS